MSKKISAYEHYLLSISLVDAVKHVFQGLRQANGELAWELIKKYNGDEWTCAPEKIHEFIAETLLKLEKDANHENK